MTESSWPAAGMRHKPRTASSHFMVIPGIRKQKRNLQQMEERLEEFGIDPGEPVLRKSGGNIFCFGEMLSTREEQEAGPTQVEWWGLLWFLFLGYD